MSPGLRWGGRDEAGPGHIPSCLPARRELDEMSIMVHEHEVCLEGLNRLAEHDSPRMPNRRVSSVFHAMFRGFLVWEMDGPGTRSRSRGRRGHDNEGLKVCFEARQRRCSE